MTGRGNRSRRVPTCRECGSAFIVLDPDDVHTTTCGACRVKLEARLQRLGELDHVMGVIRSVRASEDEFRAQVASNFDVETDDFEVESEIADGHIVHRARWSP
ncbi:hypothetical protein C5B90_06505 [Haloferax sp. Atlit-12N]|uniref:hypothetical protein n=1 Tax=Haloferax sp. Atlit-12N TaxID=2077203 RepID=UPI000E2695C4|nr:hypothetical protein [Haloferax sp. Atlit-12N]RDZ65992.1 hypothetical protein C5B90_06505 [Haloferax sp. Atlit-12N]